MDFKALPHWLQISELEVAAWINLFTVLLTKPPSGENVQNCVVIVEVSIHFLTFLIFCLIEIIEMRVQRCSLL